MQAQAQHAYVRAEQVRYATILLPLWQRPPHYTVPAHCRTSTVASQPASTQ